MREAFRKQENPLAAFLPGSHSKHLMRQSNHSACLYSRNSITSRSYVTPSAATTAVVVDCGRVTCKCWQVGPRRRRREKMHLRRHRHHAAAAQP